MAKAVRWTPKAIDTYIDVLKYLRIHWTAREEQRFVKNVDDTIKYIVLYPNGFRSSGQKRLREAPIEPHNILLYRVDPKEIVVIGLFDTRQNSKKLGSLKRGWKNR